VPDLLVVGGTGLLGRHVMALAEVHGLDAHATVHRSPPTTGHVSHRVDLRDGGTAVAELIGRLRPRAVVNAAAIMAGADLVSVTADAPGAIAAATAAIGARFVHLSTDAVFDGTNPGAYVEADPPAPVHAYGEAKARAESLVAEADPAAVIVRTSLLWADDAHGGPQVRLVQDPAVRFFVDEIRNPLRVDRLAQACLELCRRPEITGLLHVAGADAIDRLIFARALAPLAGRTADDLVGSPGDPTVARPRRCALDSSLARTLLETPLPGIHTDAPTAPD
jgi:dTDP-4-dehydrorhamnose reductase